MENQETSKEKWGKSIVTGIIGIILYVMIINLSDLFGVTATQTGQLMYGIITVLLPVFIVFTVIYGMFK